MSDVLERSAPTAADLRGDVWLGVVIFVCGTMSSALMSIMRFYGDDQLGLEWGVVVSAIAGVGIAMRRRYPITSATVVCVTYFAAVSLKVPEVQVGNVAMFISLYTIGAWVNNRRAAVVSRALLIAFMFVWLLTSMFFQATETTDAGALKGGLFSPLVAWLLMNLLINIAFFFGAYYMGERSYNSAIEREALQLRTRELEAEREVTAAQAVALDRVAIARELHDVVAHHVSAMGVQASAARIMLPKDPEATATALDHIESSARSAITELRLLLETLRSPGDTTQTVGAASTLTLDQIPELAQRVADAGMPTTFAVFGEPREVPEVVHVNLYRIAQEALTNARRHGGPNATADVRLRWDEQFVELEVTNTGRVPLAGRAGLGQLGMRERAIASGGTIEMVPRARGGFLVRAQVALGGQA